MSFRKKREIFFNTSIVQINSYAILLRLTIIELWKSDFHASNNTVRICFPYSNGKKRNRIYTYMRKNSEISSNHVKPILMVVLTEKLLVISLFVLSKLLLLKIGYFLDNVYITISLLIALIFSQDITCMCERKRERGEECYVTYFHFLKHGSNMAPQLSRFQHIKIEAILLSSGGDIYTIADIFA